MEISPQAIQPGNRNNTHKGAVSTYNTPAQIMVRMRQA